MGRFLSKLIKILFSPPRQPRRRKAAAQKKAAVQGKVVAKMKAKILTAEAREDGGLNRWFRLRHWKTNNYLIFVSNHSRDWRIFDAESPVSGTAFVERQFAFLAVWSTPDFQICLRREPENPHDSNAIIVVGQGTVNGILQERHLGYVTKETAASLSDGREISAKPHSVWLPTATCDFGLRITILVRSASYLRSI